MRGEGAGRRSFLPTVGIALALAAAALGGTPEPAGATPRPAASSPASAVGLAPASVAADTLRGRVVDESGRGLARVEVTISELGRRRATGEDGRFRFADLPPGRYTVIVRRPGWAPEVRRVGFPGQAPLRVTLRRTPFELGDVVVTTTGSPVESPRAPLPGSVLERDELRRHQGVALAKTLEELPGVRSLSTGEQVGKPVIRGLSGARVAVMDAGVPLRDYSWSDEDGPSVDARLADRVEVIRGPASVLYGSDAIGGVVNVLPRPLPETSGGDFVRGRAELSGSTNNRGTSLFGRVEGASGPVGWRVALVGRRAADFHTPESELENTGFGAVNGEAAAGLQGAWGSVSLRYDRYGGEFKLLEASTAEGEDTGDPFPGEPGPGEPALEEGGPERKLSDDRMTASATLPLEAVRLEAKLRWERHWLAEFAEEGEGGEGEPVPGEGSEAAEFELELQDYAGRLLAHHRLSDRVRGTAGVSGSHRRSSSLAERPIVPDADVDEAALFLHERASVSGDLDLFFGGRLDLRRLSAEANEELGILASERSHHAFTGSAGLALRPAPEVVLTAHLGTAWRAPTLLELYANGPRIGEALYEVGDPALDPERSLNLDAGVRWEDDRVRGELTAFRNRIDGYVAFEPTGETRQGLEVWRHSAADALLWGGEASLEVVPWEPLTLRGVTDYVRGTDRETDEPLPRIPPVRGRLEAELGSDELGWAERAHVRVGLELVAEKTRAAEDELATDGYALLDLGAGIETRWAGQPVTVDLAIHNATATEYRDFTSRYKRFALDPGRDVELRLGMDF